MRVLKNLLRLLVTGSVSLVIAACYGTPVIYGDSEARVRVVDGENEPVSGLRVYPGIDYSLEYHTTDINGEVIFFPIVDPDSGGMVNPVVRDVDGPENRGCFARTEVVLGEDASSDIVIAPNEFRYAESELICRFVTETGEPIPGLQVSLGDAGCEPGEFVTDEHGEVAFLPLLDRDGNATEITVRDQDYVQQLGYFGAETRIALQDGPEMEVVLVAEVTPEESASQRGPVEPDTTNGDKAK